MKYINPALLSADSKADSRTFWTGLGDWTNNPSCNQSSGWLPSLGVASFKIVSSHDSAIGDIGRIRILNAKVRTLCVIRMIPGRALIGFTHFLRGNDFNIGKI